MAIKFDRIEVGMTLWKTYRQQMGNFKMSTVCERSVTIAEVLDDCVKTTDGRFISRWEIMKYSLERPLLITSGLFDRVRKATKEEKALWKEGKLEERTNMRSPVSRRSE